MDQVNNVPAPTPQVPKKNTRMIVLAVIALVLLVGLGIYYMSTVGADIVDSRTAKTSTSTAMPVKSETPTSSPTTRTSTPIAITVTPTAK